MKEKFADFFLLMISIILVRVEAQTSCLLTSHGQKPKIMLAIQHHMSTSCTQSFFYEGGSCYCA